MGRTIVDESFALLFDAIDKLFFEDDLSDGMLCGVRDGKVRGARARLLVEFEHAPVKDQKGSARSERADFYVLPRDAARPACLQGFERGFFGGEARGVMLRRDHAARVAVGALARRVNALDKTRRAMQDFSHAPDFNDVYAD